MIDNGSREIPVTFKFTFTNDSDYQGFTEGHMDWQESCRVAEAHLMNLRAVFARISRLFAGYEFLVDFDPATGRLSLRHTDTHETPFGHIEIPALADRHVKSHKRKLPKN